MAADMSAIRASKALLRTQIKERLQKLTSEEKKRQSQIIYQQLINSAEFKSAQRVSVYLSTDDEVSTDALVERMFELNKAVFVPRYQGNLMQMVRLNSLQDWETLPLTKWNIKQPAASDVREDAMQTGGLDLIIAPGVAFTKDGWRMGHGKGYYDSFLTKLFAAFPTRPHVVAVCFREQLVDDLPRHDHDVHLDQIVYADH